VDIPLDGESEVLPGIRAVPVPGHTPGSYCFLAERRTAAFVGDLVISHGGRLTRAMRMANRDDNEYLESLQRFADVAPRAGFPGHGEPLLEGFGASLKALAALPRKRTDPGGILRRPLRLLRFSRQMLRTRRRR
jgi:glyoxylase-like metal-dependent hydrolase (beta-lactamase superfamily II)